MHCLPTRNFLEFRRGVVSAVATILLVALAAVPALTQTETVLYNFCSLASCADGDEPSGGLIMDSSGNLYGLTSGGNGTGVGNLFKLMPAGTESVLHDFGASPNDGSYPVGSLFMDKQGNLYGVTNAGGSYGASSGGDGTVFKVAPDGTETILHSFGATTTDGIRPVGGLIADAKGNFFGVTTQGGTNGAGTVFRLTPQGAETILHNFGGNGTDGISPQAQLIMDSKGNLYGTTYDGGEANDGVVFEVSAKGGYSVLHSFGATSGDGISPNTSLLLVAQGNLYGATYSGGTHNDGAVYKLTPGSNGVWKENVEHSFDQSNSCFIAASALLIDSKGNLYGSTLEGGTNGIGGGCIYELSPTGKLTILHTFEGAGGSAPIGNLFRDSQGNFYGVTVAGGFEDYGVAYKVTH